MIIANNYFIDLTEMNRTKSSAQTTSSKPISIAPQFRFEKVEQLTNLINGASQAPESKNNVGEKVLELLKTQIKTNYDAMYENYGDNKKKILKHIQAVETNIAGQNAMNSRFDDLVKDKSRYDRLHADVGDKQRKLKKLNQIRQKLTEEPSESKIEITIQSSNKISNLQQQRQQLEHQSYILKEMLSVRQKIQLSLREKQLRLGEQLVLKKQRQTRIAKQNDKRMQLLKKISNEIEKPEQIEIPTKLAEQLSLKMEMYQNKHSYNSIIGHEAILQGKRYIKLKEGIKSERQQQRAAKIKKDIEQRIQLEQLYNIALIKNLEEQKIKRFCGVQSIQQAFNSKSLLSAQNLQQLSIDIQEKILQCEKENKSLQEDIEKLINNQSQASNKSNLQHAQEELAQQLKQKDRLTEYLKKWEAKTHNWKIILQLLQVEPTSTQLSHFLACFEDDSRKKSLSQNGTSADNIPQLKTKYLQDKFQ